MSTSIAAPTAPLANVVPSYPYLQYSDDPDIVAFVQAFNTLAQEYLNWFNSTPLGVYSSPQVVGPLLDWVATGLYGIERPVFSSGYTKYIAGVDAFAVNTAAVNGRRYFTSGTATIASDDFYKRVLTWTLYVGNGRYLNVEVLRLRVARFLYGVNGTDVTLTQAQNVHIQPGPVAPPVAPTLASSAAGALSARKYGARQTYTNSIGETNGGGASSLSVLINHVLVVDSPAAANGATGYNIYAAVLSTNPSKFIGGVNSLPVNGMALNGTNKKGTQQFTKQNTTPIAIGTNWTEPTSGLISGTALPPANTSNSVGNFIITVPASLSASTIFQQAFQQGALPFPFMFSGTVVLA